MARDALYKGRGFKKGPKGEYKALATLLITDATIYSGEPFSYGDACYMAASKKPDTNGNPSSWRKEATNHHMALVVDMLS